MIIKIKAQNKKIKILVESSRVYKHILEDFSLGNTAVMFLTSVAIQPESPF